jgi:hypothetical protein
MLDRLVVRVSGVDSTGSELCSATREYEKLVSECTIIIKTQLLLSRGHTVA